MNTRRHVKMHLHGKSAGEPRIDGWNSWPNFWGWLQWIFNNGIIRRGMGTQRLRITLKLIRMARGKEIIDDFDIKCMTNLIGKQLSDGRCNFYWNSHQPTNKHAYCPLERIAGPDGSIVHPVKNIGDKIQVWQQSWVDAITLLRLFCCFCHCSCHLLPLPIACCLLPLPLLPPLLPLLLLPVCVFLLPYIFMWLIKLPHCLSLPHSPQLDPADNEYNTGEMFLFSCWFNF